MDSICSALALRGAQAPDRAGKRRRRARRKHERAHRLRPRRNSASQRRCSINDLSPRVADVMQPHVISVRADSPVYDALQLIEQKRLRGLPVVDERNRCLGLLSAFQDHASPFPASRRSRHRPRRHRLARRHRHDLRRRTRHRPALDRAGGAAAHGRRDDAGILRAAARAVTWTSTSSSSSATARTFRRSPSPRASTPSSSPGRCPSTRKSAPPPAPRM